MSTWKAEAISDNNNRRIVNLAILLHNAEWVGKNIFIHLQLLKISSLRQNIQTINIHRWHMYDTKCMVLGAHVTFICLYALSYDGFCLYTHNGKGSIHDEYMHELNSQLEFHCLWYQSSLCKIILHKNLKCYVLLKLSRLERLCTPEVEMAVLFKKLN